jgi:transcriptional regulator with GAF, ATPase, and Fis domain
VDPETGVLLPHTVKRRDPDSKQSEIVLSSTIVNQCINDRTSILLSDAVLDPRFSGAQSIIAQGIRSAMVVPLVANNTVYGIMHLDSRQRIGAFGEKDLQLLKALAGQAAQSIANTRLIDQKIRIRDGEVKVIGGLTRTLAVDTESGVPILRDIPVAGKMLNSQNISYENVEFVVLLQVRRLN